MFWEKEVAFNLNVPLFNLLKYFCISLLFGSVLDFSAEATDTALARRELLVNGRTKIRNKFIPRVARAGFLPEVSRRTAASLLIILLALASDILSELSYDTKLVSINTETNPISYVVVQNGTVLNNPLFGTIKDLSLSEGINCLGSLQRGVYIDHSIGIYDDGEVNIHEETSGYREHFRLRCGHSLTRSNQKYPIVIRRNSSSVEAWLFGAGAVHANRSEYVLGYRFSGPLRIKYLELITDTFKFDNSHTTHRTDLIHVAFPKSSLLCVSRLNGGFHNFRALCWNGGDRIDVLDFELGREVHERELFAGDGASVDRPAFDGYSLVRGIRSLSSFLSFTTLYHSYVGEWNNVEYMQILYLARVTVLNMKYSDEFKGREVTTQEVVRPVIRYKFFIPSLIIVATAGIMALVLLITKRTIPILTPEHVAGLWYCNNVRNGQNHPDGHPKKVYLVVGESSEGEESCQRVHVREEVKLVDKPDPHRRVVGLSH